MLTNLAILGAHIVPCVHFLVILVMSTSPICRLLQQGCVPTEDGRLMKKTRKFGIWLAKNWIETSQKASKAHMDHVAPFSASLRLNVYRQSHVLYVFCGYLQVCCRWMWNALAETIAPSQWPHANSKAMYWDIWWLVDVALRWLSATSASWATVSGATSPGDRQHSPVPPTDVPWKHSSYSSQPGSWRWIPLLHRSTTVLRCRWPSRSQIYLHDTPSEE